MPKFRPLPPIASAPIEQDHARQREEPARRAHEVEAPACGAARRAERGAALHDLRAPDGAEDRLRRQHGGEQRDDVPMPSVNAKPLTPAVARMKRMNAVITVTTFASMIAERPFL